jgi:hypothetical protein
MGKDTMRKIFAFLLLLLLINAFALSGCVAMKPVIRDSQDQADSGGDAACEEVCYTIRSKIEVGCLSTSFNDVLDIHLSNCSGTWEGDVNLKVGLYGPTPFTFVDTYPESLFPEPDEGLELVPLVPQEPTGENSFRMDFAFRQGLTEGVNIDEDPLVALTTVGLNIEIDAQNRKVYFKNVDVLKELFVIDEYQTMEDLFEENYEDTLYIGCMD